MRYEIAKPCTQDWNKMKAVEGGHFCEHCSKKVHDLTNGKKLTNLPRNFCGRINTAVPKKLSFSTLLLKRNPWVYLQLFFLIFVSTKIKAQLSKFSPQNIDLEKNETDSTRRELVLSGTVIDSATKEPMAFARGWVFDREQNLIAGFSSDMDGNFTLKFDQRTGADTMVSLRVSREGYVPLELHNIPLTKRNICVQVPIDSISMKPIGQILAMGAIVQVTEAIYAGAPAYFDLEDEKADPEKFERLHGQTPGIKSRFDNRSNNR